MDHYRLTERSSFRICAGSTAIWQREVALGESERASQNYSAAKSAADGLINDLAKNLRNIKGVKQETTRTLLTAAEGVMQKLIKTAPIPELLLSQIELYYQFELTYWYVGDINSALNYAINGINLCNHVIKTNKNATAIKFARDHLYEDLIERGNILRVLGDLKTSLDSFRKAKELAEEMIKLKTDQDKQAWMRLGRAEGRIGDVMRTAGQFEEAEQEYREAKIIQERFLDNNPEDKDWLGQLSWSDNRLADNFLRITNHEGLMAVGVDRSLKLKDDKNLGLAVLYYGKGLGIRRLLTSMQASKIPIISAI